MAPGPREASPDPSPPSPPVRDFPGDGPPVRNRVRRKTNASAGPRNDS